MWFTLLERVRQSEGIEEGIDEETEREGRREGVGYSSQEGGRERTKDTNTQ